MNNNDLTTPNIFGLTFNEWAKLFNVSSMYEPTPPKPFLIKL